MAEENKDLTPDPKKEGDVEESKGSEAEKGSEEEPKKEETDFDTLLKLERERGRQEGAAEIAFKERKERREEKEDGESEEEDKPLTRKDLGVVLTQERQSIRKELQVDAIAEKAGKRAVISGIFNDALKNLIIEIHKNRSFPDSMSLDEQLDEATAIALSKPSMKARMDEIKRSTQGRENISDNPAGTHKEPPVSGEPRLEPKDVSAIKSAGYVWDGRANAWKLETKSRIVFKSKDLKKTWHVLK